MAMNFGISCFILFVLGNCRELSRYERPLLTAGDSIQPAACPDNTSPQPQWLHSWFLFCFNWKHSRKESLQCVRAGLCMCTYMWLYDIHIYVTVWMNEWYKLLWGPLWREKQGVNEVNTSIIYTLPFFPVGTQNGLHHCPLSQQTLWGRPTVTKPAFTAEEGSEISHILVGLCNHYTTRVFTALFAVCYSSLVCISYSVGCCLWLTA